MLRLALIAALAAEPDAGVPLPDWSAPIYGQCPEAPPPEQLDGGAWLFPPARAARVDCLMATCDVRRQELESTPAASVVIAASVALVVGAAAGAAVAATVVWKRDHP